MSFGQSWFNEKQALSTIVEIQYVLWTSQADLLALISTIVEIQYVLWTHCKSVRTNKIYNSRNSICPLDLKHLNEPFRIYNSRNSICPLDCMNLISHIISTIVEIQYVLWTGQPVSDEVYLQ